MADLVKSLRGLLAFVTLLCVWACSPTAALAQSTYTTPSGPRVAGVAQLLCDASGANCTPTPGDTTGQYVVGVTSAVANAGSTQVSTAVAGSTLTIKTSAGNLYGLNVVAGASAGFLLVYNLTAAPADGTVTPRRCYPLAANTGLEINLRGQPSYFSTGMVAVFSTTGCFAQTASATAFISADYK